ncbi:MAG: hypothetical protein IKL53_06810 [Lachnospiraceae bacterium]|nr:hypothetical protein [Lachnospiraceae bacterium]
MISSLIMNPRLEPNVGPAKLNYTLDPYDKAEGPLRAMQKFAVILLTTVGSDPIRPWFGTYISRLCRMNVVDRTETKIFVRDQVSEAIRQFFKLQSEEATQNRQTADDVITSIELVDLDLSADNNVFLRIKFESIKYSSVIYSMRIN